MRFAQPGVTRADYGVGMVVVLTSLAIALLLTLATWAVGADPESLVWVGLGVAALGFAYGIPTALVYHWLLYRALVRAKRLPARWWVSPTSHHALVRHDDRRSIYLCARSEGVGSS